eukprot:9244752-Alexandrium_andersonii.AAC.1
MCIRDSPWSGLSACACDELQLHRSRRRRRRRALGGPRASGSPRASGESLSALSAQPNMRPRARRPLRSAYAKSPRAPPCRTRPRRAWRAPWPPTFASVCPPPAHGPSARRSRS